NLQATAVSSSQINLLWSAPSNNRGSPVTGYEIDRSADGGTTWNTIVSNTGTTATTYSDTNLTPNTPYSYHVSAVNSVGTSLPSKTASATTTIAPPAAPTGVTATPKSSTKITTSWTASAGATWYQVFNSTSSSGPFVKFGGTSGTSLVNSGLHPNTAYYYVVQASNTGGSSPFSSPPASAITPSGNITQAQCITPPPNLV